MQVRYMDSSKLGNLFGKEVNTLVCGNLLKFFYLGSFSGLFDQKFTDLFLCFACVENVDNCLLM